MLKKNTITLHLLVKITYCALMSGKVKRMWIRCLVPDLTHSHILFPIALRLREVILTHSTRFMDNQSRGSPCWAESTGRSQPSDTDRCCFTLTHHIHSADQRVLCLPCCYLIKVTFGNKVNDLEYCVVRTQTP